MKRIKYACPHCGHNEASQVTGVFFTEWEWHGKIEPCIKSTGSYHFECKKCGCIFRSPQEIDKNEELIKICRKILAAYESATPGPWRKGIGSGAIVCDKEPGERGTDEKTIEFYGGFPLAESFCEKDADLTILLHNKMPELIKEFLEILEEPTDED